jgi:hypothetical protein
MGFLDTFNTTQLRNYLPDMPISLISEHWPLSLALTAICGSVAYYAGAGASHLPSLDDISRLIFSLLCAAFWIHFLVEIYIYKEPSSKPLPSTASNLRALAAAASETGTDDSAPTVRTVEVDKHESHNEGSRILPGLFEPTDFATWYPSEPTPTSDRVLGRDTYQCLSNLWIHIRTRYFERQPRKRPPPPPLREIFAFIIDSILMYLDKALQGYQWLTRDVFHPMPTRMIPGLYPTDAFVFPSVEWNESGNWPDPGRLYLDFDIIDEVLEAVGWVMDKVVWNTWTPWGWLADKLRFGEIGLWHWDGRNELARQLRESWEEDFQAGF